jgi:hypothetical protein
MGFNGGKLVGGMTLVLILAISAEALTACVYTDDEAGPATTPPASTSRTAPPTADPALARELASNQTQLDRILGPRPSDLVLGGSGGLSGDGHRTSLPGLPKGSYLVTSSCVGGVTEASLLIARPDRRGGTNYELELKCGRTGGMIVKLETGPVFAHLVPTTTVERRAAVAGFWMVPAP